MTTLAIAGWRIRLECRPAEMEGAVAGRYAAFVVSDETPPDAQVTVTVGPEMVSASRGELSTQIRVDFQEEAALVYAPDACGRININSWMAWLDSSRSAFSSNLEYFLRILCALLAYRSGGLMMHGAGLLVGKQAYLFIGHSGSGKSTVVALSVHALALGDDLILLRPEDAGWRAYGTPFWNEGAPRREGQTASGLLIGIYSLVQDRDVYLQTMTPAAVTAGLAANCPVVSGDVTELPGLLRRCQRLGADVSVQLLHFRKDATFWNLLLDQES